jgi:hypothetical protein
MSTNRRLVTLTVLAACVLAAVTAPTASAALRSPKLIANCPSGSTYQEQTRGPFRLEGCLVSESTRFITAPGTTAAELSGFDISLVGGKRLALMKNGDPRITSVGSGKGSKVQVRIKRGPINTVIHEGSLDLTSDSGVDFDFDLGQIPGTAKLLGLEIEGDVQGKIGYAMQASGTNVEANLKFPEILGGAVLALDLGVTDGTGLQLNSLELASGSGTLPFDDVPGAFVKDVQIKFTAPSNVTVGGKIVLPMIVPQSFGGTLSFNAQGFSGASGSIGGLNLPIDPATGIFFLQGGSVNVGINPLSFGGSITLSAGPVEETSGAHIVKFTGGFQFVNSDPSKIELTGTTTMLGLGNLQALDATQKVTYASNNVLSLKQTVNLNLSVADVGGLSGKATISGSFANNGFQVAGTGSLNFSAFGITLAGASGSFKANGTGYGACVTGNFFGASVTGQGRADWGDDVALDLGCNLNRFKNRSLSRSAGLRATPPGGSFALAAGATNAAIRVRGTSGPPAFDLRLPDGTVLQVRDPKTGATAVGGRAVHRVVAADTTAVYITNPPAGTYTVSDIPGQPLADVQVADDSPPSVSATVTGTGEKRTLNWTAGDLDGGRLQIAEVQADGTQIPLVDTTLRTGNQSISIPFGKAGTRQLVATVTDEKGIPRATVPAGGYLAPKPFVPSAPRDVGVSFNKKTEQLTFSQVQPADPGKRPDFWYYKVSLADGRVLYFQGSGTQKIKVRDVADQTKFRVSVFGVETEGIQGKARTEKGTA